MIGDDVLEQLGDQMPADHARQTMAEAYVERFMHDLRNGDAPPAVMDLGCGAGNSVDQFRALDPGTTWVGVDVEESPEVASRTRGDAEFVTFDGVHLPLEDSSLDLVLCKQVLEHVRTPAPLLAEVGRVLRPGGYFAGSTSQLEPFHSLSTGNYTPYGLGLLLADAGLEALEFRPGIDGLTMLAQRGFGMHPFFDRWWARESPLNRAINLFGRVARLDTRAVNAVKLIFCGQFTFLARRPLG